MAAIIAKIFAKNHPSILLALGGIGWMASIEGSGMLLALGMLLQFGWLAKFFI